MLGSSFIPLQGCCPRGVEGRFAGMVAELRREKKKTAVVVGWQHSWYHEPNPTKLGYPLSAGYKSRSLGIFRRGRSADCWPS